MNRGNSVAKGTQRPTLIYPSHWPTPEDLLHFVEEPGFEDDWKSLGLNVADDLTALQLMIMTNPKGSPVVKGTGGGETLPPQSRDVSQGQEPLK